MSLENKSEVLKINGNSINLIKVSKLNLLIITDLNNFGSYWSQCIYNCSNNVFTTKTLFGANEDTFAPIVRYWTQVLVQNKQISPQLDSTHDIVFTFNISLRNTDTDTVREIAKYL